MPLTWQRAWGKVRDTFLNFWFRGIFFEPSGTPAEVALGGYPSAKERPEVAAAELDQSLVLGKIAGYNRGDRRRDLRACPSQLIAKTWKARTGHGWSDMAYGLNRL